MTAAAVLVECDLSLSDDNGVCGDAIGFRSVAGIAKAEIKQAKYYRKNDWRSFFHDWLIIISILIQIVKAHYHWLISVYFFLLRKKSNKKIKAPGNPHFSFKCANPSN